MIEQIPEFLMNHAMLSAAAAALVGALIWTTFQPGGGARLSPMDATRLISHEDAVVLDVRGDEDFRRGHIVNAVNIPEGRLASQAKKLERYKGRPIIATCRSGQSSSAAIKTLRGLGFENLYQLSGGISAWEGANLPLTKDGR